MPASKRLLWGGLISAVLGVQALAIWYFLAESAPQNPPLKSASTRPHGGPTPPHPALSRRQLEAGVPVARARIDEFIDGVSSCDFEQCSAYLHQQTSPGEDLVFDVGVHSQEIDPSMRFAQVLADRRVAKLHALLKAMPAAVAAQRADVLFEEKVDIHESDWLRAIERRREGGDGPGANPPMIPISYNVHALSAALFLCAAHCEPQILVQKLDRWNSRLRNVVAMIRRERELMWLWGQASMDALPENLFLLNVYTFVLERHGCAQAEQLKELTGQPIPPFTTVPFCAWDAHTNPFDFTHIHKGVPVDESKVLMNVSWAKSWGGLDTNEERQQQILDAVRALVEDCAGKVDAK